MVKFNFTLSAVNGEKKTDSKGNPLANGYGNKQD